MDGAERFRTFGFPLSSGEALLVGARRSSSAATTSRASSPEKASKNVGRTPTKTPFAGVHMFFSIGEQTEKNSKKATIQGGLFLCPGIQNDSIYAQLLVLKLLTFNKIWLMPSSRTAVNPISTDLMLSSICSGRLAPMMAELTPGWRRIQARAS